MSRREEVSTHSVLLKNELIIEAEAAAEAKTGVATEARTAVSAAALIVYNMCKEIDEGMQVDPFVLFEEEGGKSGHYRRG